MADLTQKYHIHTIPWYEVILKRFYIGDDPNSVGTVDFWKYAIMQLYDQMPFPTLWKGIEMEIWDMNCPDLINSTKATLLDYDLSQSGNQSAVGLYFGNKRLALGIYHNIDRIYGDHLDYSRQALPHEFGHLYADMCGFTKDISNIEKELTQQFRNLRPHQSENEHEDYAETYRAILGTDVVRNKFSDGKIYYYNPTIKTLLKCSYWLSQNLKDKFISDFTLFDGWCRWTQYERSWWNTITTYYALTENWDQFKWDGSTWHMI